MELRYINSYTLLLLLKNCTVSGHDKEAVIYVRVANVLKSILYIVTKFEIYPWVLGGGGLLS